MRKIHAPALIMILILSSMFLTACAKSEFGIIDNTEKRMLINAKNAAKDDFFMVGTLEVDDNEQITITSNLARGSVRVEIIGMPEDQSIDNLPEPDGEPVLTANVKATDSAAAEMSPGSYVMRAICLEKATGTVEIEVLPR